MAYFILFLCTCVPLFSAGPTVHLWVAEKFCELYGITEPSMMQQVMIGTEYPDIRYVTGNPRSWTHPDIQDLREVLNSTVPFEIGMKLHAWVDFVREAYIKPEVYAATEPYHEGRAATFLKFLEEEILADLYDGRQWSPFFYDVMQEEYTHAEKDAILKWHNLIQWTLSVRPSWLLWTQSYKGPAFGLPAATLYNWSYLLPNLKTEAIFQEHMHGLMQHLLDELQKRPIPSVGFLNLDGI